MPTTRATTVYITIIRAESMISEKGAGFMSTWLTKALPGFMLIYTLSIMLAASLRKYTGVYLYSSSIMNDPASKNM